MLEGLFQPMHLLVILGIALLVFGPKKLPELGKGFGEGIRGFKAGGEAVRYSRQRWRERELRECAVGGTNSAPRRVALNYSVLINFSTFRPLPTAFPPV